jgi:hypothetical protein
MGLKCCAYERLPDSFRYWRISGSSRIECPIAAKAICRVGEGSGRAQIPHHLGCSTGPDQLSPCECGIQHREHSFQPESPFWTSAGPVQHISNLRLRLRKRGITVYEWLNG